MHYKITVRLTLLVAVLAGFFLWPVPLGAQPQFDVVHAFAAPGAVRPYSTLVEGMDGNFYGTTSEGGTGNQGTIFRMTPAGVVTILHSFFEAGGRDPRAGLLLANDGNFYGTTSRGGASGFGTIYRMTPAGVVTIVHSFSGTRRTGRVRTRR